MKFLNIGYQNIIMAQRIVAIVSPESAPIKRIIQDSRSAGMLIDATGGRKTKSVIFTDSAHVILSWLQPKNLKSRLENDGADKEQNPPVT